MVKNFLFHRVNPERDPLWDPMHPDLFDKCLAHIKANYITVQLEEFLGDIKSYDPKKNYASIVFDDGYHDNLEYAAPLLSKHKIKASFYVVTDCINNNIPTWTHILEHQFRFTRKKSLLIEEDFIPVKFRKSEFKNDEDRLNFAKALKPFLKTIPHEQRNLVLKHINENFNDVELPKLMMNWNDVRQLNNDGHYIGSHTLSHCMLGTMADEAEIMQELKDSAEIIKEEVGYHPDTISYPVGSYNQITKDLSKKAGYKYGLAVKQDKFDPEKNDLFEIPRIELYNESYFKTYLRMTNVLENTKRLIRYRK